MSVVQRSERSSESSERNGSECNERIGSVAQRNVLVARARSVLNGVAERPWSEHVSESNERE